MTKNNMVIEIARVTGQRQVDIKKIVQMMLDNIIDILVDERRIELRNFGVFVVKERKARKARNPRTGEEVDVPRKTVVTFKPGKLMEERIAALCKHESSAAGASQPTNTAHASSDQAASTTAPP